MPLVFDNDCASVLAFPRCGSPGFEAVSDFVSVEHPTTGAVFDATRAARAYGCPKTQCVAFAKCVPLARMHDRDDRRARRKDDRLRDALGTVEPIVSHECKNDFATRQRGEIKSVLGSG